MKELGCGAWLHEPGALDRVRAAWAELDTLVGWLVDHVGPRTGRR